MAKRVGRAWRLVVPRDVPRVRWVLGYQFARLKFKRGPVDVAAARL